MKCRFTELLQSAEDFLVDIPNLWGYTAELVEPLFDEDVVNLNFLGQLSSFFDSTLVANFVAAVLKELVKAQVLAWTYFFKAVKLTVLRSSFPTFDISNHCKRQMRVP